jgi:hypothetical protein
MINSLNLHTQYITDEKGEKTAVILPISEFEELLEEFEDLVTLTQRKDESTIDHEDLINELKQDGLLSN